MLLLLALPFRYKHLWQMRTPKVIQGPAYWAKQVCTIFLALDSSSVFFPILTLAPFLLDIRPGLWSIPAITANCMDPSSCSTNANVSGCCSVGFPDLSWPVIPISPGTFIFYPTFLPTQFLSILVSLV